MENEVYRPVDRDEVGDVMLDELEVWMRAKVGEVGFRTGDEVIDADHPMAFVEKPIAEMGTEKPRAAGNNGCGHGKSRVLDQWINGLMD